MSAAPEWLTAFLQSSQWAFVCYFLGVNALYVALFVASFHAIQEHLRHMSYRDLGEILRSKLAPPVSVLVPAHNEETSIVSSVKSIFHLTYPEFEIIVVNDGSTDHTLEKLIAAFKLRKTRWIYHKILPTKNVRAIYVSPLSTRWARLVVIDKEKGGKADALNAGINVSRHPLFCSVDADSMLERDSLLRVVIPFMERFAETVASGGIVRIANGCWISNGIVRIVRLSRSWLPRFQTVEYMRAFLSGRIAWSYLGSLLIVSGAFGLFKKSAVLAAGGYDASTVGEDMELVVRLHHRFPRCRVEFIPDTVCWTEAPETWRSLWRQRNRWQRGLGQALRRHLPMAFNPRFGLIGMVAFPYFWLVEFLSPLAECLGLLTFAAAVLAGAFSRHAFVAFSLLTVLMGIVFSLFAVLLEEFTLRRYPHVRDLMGLLAASVFEHVGYRQFVNLARFDGLLDFIRNRSGWGVLEKRGLRAGRACLAACALLPALAPSARAEREVVDAGFAYEDYSFAVAGRQQWTQVTVTAGPKWSVLVTQTLVRRFAITQAQGGGGVVWRPSAKTAYEARLIGSPEGVLLPTFAARGLLYRGLPGGFTFNPGYSFSRYELAHVHTASLGLDWEGRALVATVRLYGSVTSFRSGTPTRSTPGTLALVNIPLARRLKAIPSYSYREESFQAGAPGATASALFKAHTGGIALLYEPSPRLGARASWQYEGRKPFAFVRRYELATRVRF